MGQSFKADYSGVKPQAGGGITILPPKDAEGKAIRYLGKIVKAEGKKGAESGNPYVSYDVKTVGGEFDGKEIRYQNVTFLPKTHKYAGISLHKLRVLREPFEGAFEVTPANWVGKMIYFTVSIEQGDKGERNKIERLECPTIAELVDFGEFGSSDDAPQWMRDKEEAEAAGGKKDAPKAAAKTGKTAAEVRAEKKTANPPADAPCEVCTVAFKDHAGKAHEYVEGIPF